MPNRFCTQCGQPLNDYTKFCVNCGAPVPSSSYTDNATNNQYQYSQQPQQQYAQQPQNQHQPLEPKPSNYLVISIITTILCCWPIGIPAIINASKVNKLWDSGDYAGAQEASKRAKTFTIISAVLGLVVTVIYVILYASGEL